MMGCPILFNKTFMAYGRLSANDRLSLTVNSHPRTLETSNPSWSQGVTPKRNHLKRFCFSDEILVPTRAINRFSGFKQIFGSLV